MHLGFGKAHSREPARGVAREPPGTEAGGLGAHAQDETVSNGEGQPHVLPLHLGDVPGPGALCLPPARAMECAGMEVGDDVFGVDLGLWLGHDGMRWNDDEDC